MLNFRYPHTHVSSSLIRHTCILLLMNQSKLSPTHVSSSSYDTHLSSSSYEHVKLQAAVAAAEAEVRRVLEEGTGAEASAARTRSESISALQLQLKEAESARDSAQQRLAAMEKVYNVLLVWC